jgi:hypothetical protein
MPQIAELTEIDGAIWARIPMDGGSPVQLLNPTEIEANSRREQGYLAEIASLRATLIQIRAVCEDNPNMTTNFIDDVARIALSNEQKMREG